MMIKLRAWYPMIQKMEYQPPVTNINGEYKSLYYDSEGNEREGILMRSLNIVDKDNNQLYDGDVVKVIGIDNKIVDTYTVDDIRWNQPLPTKTLRYDVVDGNTLRCWLKNESFGYEGEELVYPCDCVCVGNIHESPELLNNI